MAEVDQKVWAEKDRRSVRAMCLSYSKDLIIAGFLELKDIATTASEFEHFVYNGLESQENTKKEVPMPTQTQQEWLGKIKDKYGYESTMVLKCYGKYPSTQTEAKGAIKACQNGKY